MTETKDDKFWILESALYITPYTGERNPVKISLYIYAALDRFNGNPEDERLLIQLLLRDRARAWLEKCRGKPEWLQLSGKEVLANLKEEFVPEDYAIRALMKLRRGSRSLQVYLAEFDALRHILSEDAGTDFTLAFYLLEGCGEPFASDIKMMGINSFPERLEFLQRQANYFACFPENGPQWSVDTGRPDASTRTRPVSNADALTMSDEEIMAINAAAMAALICLHCRKKGHLRRDCRKRKADTRKHKEIEAQSIAAELKSY